MFERNKQPLALLLAPSPFTCDHWSSDTVILADKSLKTVLGSPPFPAKLHALVVSRLIPSPPLPDLEAFHALGVSHLRDVLGQGRVTFGPRNLARNSHCNIMKYQLWLLRGIPEVWDRLGSVIPVYQDGWGEHVVILFGCEASGRITYPVRSTSTFFYLS